MHTAPTRTRSESGWYRTAQADRGASATLSGEAAAESRINLVDLAIYVTWIGIVATIFI